MNNTTKSKYDLAEKMLKGKIDVEEVVLMSGLSEEEVLKIKESVTPNNPDAKVLKNLDTVDLNINQVLFDDYDNGENDSDILDPEQK